MATSPTLRIHGGLSERPKPGCSGMSTSCLPARLCMNGPQTGHPPAPWRNKTRSPLPSRRSRTLTSRVLCRSSCTAIADAPSPRFMSWTLLRLDARRLDDAAPARDVGLDLPPHLLRRRRRSHVAALGEPLLHVGQRERGADLLIDAIDDGARRR